MSYDYDCADPTDPQYYLDRGAHSDAEAEMRADDTVAYRMRKAAAEAETSSARGALIERANRTEHRWLYSGDARPWKRLHDTVTTWESTPSTRLLYQSDGGAGMPSDCDRNHQQARELTGNGSWISMPTPDAARHYPQA